MMNMSCHGCHLIAMEEMEHVKEFWAKDVATVAQGAEALSWPLRHAIAQFNTGFNFGASGA